MQNYSHPWIPHDVRLLSAPKVYCILNKKKGLPLTDLNNQILDEKKIYYEFPKSCNCLKL